MQREAERLGIEVRTPVSLKGEAEQAGVSRARGRCRRGRRLRAAAAEGRSSKARGSAAYNGHASLLPRWRGAAPIQRAIMAGDHETGMMVMKMEEGLDTGPVALTERVAIGADETAGELHDRLMQVGAPLMVEALAKLKPARWR